MSRRTIPTGYHRYDLRMGYNFIARLVRVTDKNCDSASYLAQSFSMVVSACMFLSSQCRDMRCLRAFM